MIPEMLKNIFEVRRTSPVYDVDLGLRPIKFKIDAPSLKDLAKGKITKSACNGQLVTYAIYPEAHEYYPDLGEFPFKDELEYEACDYIDLIASAEPINFYFPCQPERHAAYFGSVITDPENTEDKYLRLWRMDSDSLEDPEVKRNLDGQGQFMRLDVFLNEKETGIKKGRIYNVPYYQEREGPHKTVKFIDPLKDSSVTYTVGVPELYKVNSKIIKNSIR